MSRPSHASHVWLFAFVDVLLVLTFVLMSYAFMAIPLINPPAKDNPNMPPPGSIAVLACWPEGPIDVDLWTSGPGQEIATGYSNKSGRVWSLLRDDLGTAADDSPVNCESAFARITPAGSYVVNIHGYSLPTGPVTVHVEIALNGKLLAKTDMEIKPKQERTVLAWTMDAAGNVTGSNTVYHALRSAKK